MLFWELLNKKDHNILKMHMNLKNKYTKGKRVSRDSSTMKGIRALEEKGTTAKSLHPQYSFFKIKLQ